jgi:tricorn protease
MPRYAVRALVLAAALALTAAPALAAPQFLRRPDVHGDRIVFQSEGDLWIGSIAGRTASRVTKDEGVEGPAYFSPDGDRIAFTAQYDGTNDVYVMDASGGLPKRLTWDPTGALALGWSRNGSEVLFRSRRASGNRRNRFWAVPVTGGAPRLLPIPFGEFASAAADGRRIAYVPVSAEWQHWKRYRGGEADDVWLADTVAHTFHKLTNDPGVDTEPVWAGGSIVFVSERDGHANLWRIDPGTGQLTSLTRYVDYDVRYPGTDGQRVVYEHGDGLGMVDLASGRAQELAFDLHSDRIHARQRLVPAVDRLFGVAFGPTGKRLLVSARGQVLSAPAEHGDVRVVAAPGGARAQYPAWSPDARRCAFVSDAGGEEQIWITGAAGGEAKPLTRGHQGPLGPLVWSPDGKRIATSDREMRILLADAATGAWTTVDQADRGGSYDLVLDAYRFSPDGRWLAFARQEPNWNWAVYLYDIAAGRAVRVSDPEMSAYAPAFDPGGKYLVFLADRAFNARAVNANRFFTFDGLTKVSLVVLAADGHSPFLEAYDEETGAGDDEKSGAKADSSKTSVTRVDVAGIASRVVDVPLPADRYLAVEPAGKRLLLLVQGDPAPGSPANEARELRAFDLKKKETEVLTKRLTSFQLSGDRKKMLLRTGRSFTVADADAAKLDADKGKVDTSGWMLTIDPAAEWRQILHETWRIARDFFYDPAMHGVDWAAVRAKYDALLPAVADRSDVAFLQGEIVAELNCGHAYIVGGDIPGASGPGMGYLGIDATFVPGPTPAYRIDKLYPGDGFDLDTASPLLAPGLGVKPGQYLLAIDGRPVRAGEELAALLVGTSGRVVAVTLNARPSLAGSREVRVKTLTSERAARVADWVASRAEYVRTHGGANLGYVWIPNMSGAGLSEWGKHYYPQLGKDGMIYDVRFNGGGYIDAMLLLQASSKPYSWFKPRYGASWTRQDWAFAGHAAALCNESSGSDAEEFSDAFQRLKLGPVIGARTWGGEVGSGDGYPLVDGGSVYVPNYGEWVPSGEWVIEGTGVTPDMPVDDDPAALMAGRDPQLDRAIEYLKGELARDPIVRPRPPAFPNKSHR